MIVVLHIQEDGLEQYVMRTLPDLEIEPLEVHLFKCSECRIRFVAVLNMVEGLPQTRERKSLSAVW
jgi:hypothetical protein